jgi:hypothetical protein
MPKAPPPEIPFGLILVRVNGQPGDRFFELDLTGTGITIEDLGFGRARINLTPPGGFVPVTTQVIAGLGLFGGGALTGNVTLNVGANPDGSIIVNPNDIQVGVLATDAQHGNRGGGALHALATPISAGFMSSADFSKLAGLPTSAVPTSRTLIAGAGLVGGGDLSADRTFDVGANPDGSIIVNPNDIQVGVLATDAQHGNRGGGALHALATITTPGFMSAADKAKLDTLGGPGARVFQNVAQSIPNSTNTVLTFTSENFDDANMHDNVVNPSRITIPESGRYLIQALVRFVSNANGSRTATLRLNGITTLAVEGQRPLSGLFTSIACSTVENLAAGDYVEVLAFQSSGGALSTVTGRDATFFIVQKIK